MSVAPNALSVRPARDGDAAELCSLLNEIIAVGGTTAHETQLTDATFKDYFLVGQDHLSCQVAENDDGLLLGFQSLERNAKLPPGWGDIATFARLQPKVPGVGRALFAATLAVAKDLGLVAINATIRADNTSGLGYYGKMGFQDYAVKAGVPLSDGTPVDRISKRYMIA